MACRCEELAGGEISLSPTCLGHLWIFQDLAPAGLKALSEAAQRNRYKPGMYIRIDWLLSRADSLSHTNLEERLYRVLVNVAREHGRAEERGLVIAMPFTHEELGFLVGAHRVSITRAMKDLKSSGRVIQAGKQFIVAEL